MREDVTYTGSYTRLPRGKSGEEYWLECDNTFFSREVRVRLGMSTTRNTMFLEDLLFLIKILIIEVSPSRYSRFVSLSDTFYTFVGHGVTQSASVSYLSTNGLRSLSPPLSRYFYSTNCPCLYTKPSSSF